MKLIVTKDYVELPAKKFTGISLIFYDEDIAYCFWKDGKIHRNNKPAMYSSSNYYYFKNNKIHRKDGPAHIAKNVGYFAGFSIDISRWYYDGVDYGTNFNMNTWKKKVKFIKAKKRLGIFI